MGSKDVKGNFGKHIIVHPKPLSLEEAKTMVKLILKEINMTPIMAKPHSKQTTLNNRQTSEVNTTQCQVSTSPLRNIFCISALLNMY